MVPLEVGEEGGTIMEAAYEVAENKGLEVEVCRGF